jgi:hypothetical protein
MGGAARVAGAWDSAAGAELALVRVRERAAAGAGGLALGAQRWTAREGGRLWLEAIAGTRIGDRMYGVTLGPVLELAPTARARPGAAVGVWAHFGLVLYARVAITRDLGPVAELGVRIALPAVRWGVDNATAKR